MKKRFSHLLIAAILLSPLAVVKPETPKVYASTNLIVDPNLTNQLANLAPTDSMKVILTYSQMPSQSDLANLQGLGIVKATALQQLPMVIASLTKTQIQNLLASQFPNLVSIYADKQLDYYLDKSTAQIGAKQNRLTPSMGFSGKGIGVAVVDSGIDGLHSDLHYGTRVIQNVKALGDSDVTGYNAPVYAEGVPDTDNAGGHGTHCAGIIGGDGTASGGTYEGVAPAANLVGVSTGATLLIVSALEGFDYVLTHQYQYNIKVVSNSWGTSGNFDPNNPINIASKYLHDRGITVVFAAGNNGPGANTQNPYSDAPWVISVAAGTKDTGLLADFSSRGIQGDTLVHPTITAPGVDIISTRADQSVLSPLSAQKDAAMIPAPYLPYYTTMSGTSMATPHIAGVAALLEEANPQLTPDQVKQILQDTATKMPGYQQFEVGAGFVNAYAAIDKAQHMDHSYGAVINQTYNAAFNGSVDAPPTTDAAYDPTNTNGTNFTMNVKSNAQVSDLTIAWDSPANVLRVNVTAPDGTTTTYGANLLGAVYGTETAISIPTPLQGQYKIQVVGLKGIVGVPDTVHFTYRTYYGTFSGLNDIAGSPYETAIRASVSKRLYDSINSSNFYPNWLITKGELARWIASDFEIRQNQTQAVNFGDVSANLAPYVSAVTANAAPMRDIFWQGGSAMTADSSTAFGTFDYVNRANLAVALVKANGLDSLAQQNMNTATTYTDDAQIPAAARGYVVVATQKGLMKGYVNQSVEGAAPTYSFKPLENVTRGSLAYNLMNGYHYFTGN